MLPQCDKIKHHLYLQHLLALTRDYCPHIHMYFVHDCNAQPSGSRSIPWSRRMGRRFSLELSAAMLELNCDKQHTGHCGYALIEVVDYKRFHTQHHI